MFKAIFWSNMVHSNPLKAKGFGGAKVGAKFADRSVKCEAESGKNDCKTIGIAQFSR